MSENLKDGVKMVLKESITDDSYGTYLVYPNGDEKYVGVAEKGLENSGKYEVIKNEEKITPPNVSLPEEDNSLMGTISNVFSKETGSEDFSKAIGNVAASLTDVINGSDESNDLLTKLFGSKMVADIKKRKKIEEFFKEELKDSGIEAVVAKVKKEFDIPEDYEIEFKLKVKFE